MIVHIMTYERSTLVRYCGLVSQADTHLARFDLFCLEMIRSDRATITISLQCGRSARIIIMSPETVLH